MMIETIKFVEAQFQKERIDSKQSCNESSSLSPACLESEQDPSPAGYESESRCLWLESESESQGAEISQL